MSDDDSGFGHSLTDLMASVAVMFLLIAAIFMVRSLNVAKKAKRDLATAAEKQSNDFGRLSELQAKLSELKDLDGIAEVQYDPEVDPGLLTVIYSDQSLGFASGRCQPRAVGLTTIRTRIPEVLRPMCATVELFDESVAKISLEGHTDATPYFPRYPSCGITVSRLGQTCAEDPSASTRCAGLGFENNVRLSGARAQNVYFELRDAIEGSDDLTRCLDSRFIVAGRGPVEPLDGGDWRTPRSPEELELNRRVVMKVRVSPRVRLSAGQP